LPFPCTAFIKGIHAKESISAMKKPIIVLPNQTLKTLFNKAKIRADISHGFTFLIFNSFYVLNNYFHQTYLNTTILLTTISL
tara:strand:+ start:1022 stop:1267 length:246 start_codon:yes stop_codon:yes gene_type:complete